MQRNEFISEFPNIKRIVIKIGSNLIVQGDTIQYNNLENLIRCILFLKKLKKEVILVSSGAVALGRKKLKKSF
jgi:glutamate 5-kinase